MDGGFSCKPEYAGAEADVGAVIQRMANKEKEIIEFMSQGFCERCRDLLLRRIEIVSRKFDGVSVQNNSSEISDTFCSVDSRNFLSSEDSPVPSTNGSHHHENSPWSSNRTPESLHSTRQKGQVNKSSPESVSSGMQSFDHHNSEMVLDDGLNDASPVIGNGAVEKSPALSREQREMIRFQLVGRKKDFVHIERINGKPMNVLQGLELHTRVFSAAEQKKIVDYVYNLQRMGQKGQLRERTYSEPRKWMRGKGRVTIQFGCCYNYAVDKNGNPPGILRDEEVDPLPPLFKTMIKRMIRWHVLPPKCVPNSCIVNIYDEGDCIPPHIDHHDFLRPFCTVSFLTECNILFGSNLKILNPGEFSGPVKIPLPVGSVLILNGNGADVSKHCVPGVPARRISITFRKMDESKLPYTFSPDPELQGLTPLVHASSTKFLVQPNFSSQQVNCNNTCSSDDLEVVRESSGSPFLLGKDDFPPLGSGSKSVKKTRINGIRH